MPVAVNWMVFPAAMEGLAGVMARDTSVAAVTVSCVEALTPFNWAPTMMVPTPTLVARPLLPAALLTVATAALEESHVTAALRSGWWSRVQLTVTANRSDFGPPVTNFGSPTTSRNSLLDCSALLSCASTTA